MLLLADMRALQPDILGLQEVIFPLQQDRLMGAAGQRSIALRGEPAEPEIGNSLLVRESIPIAALERRTLARDATRHSIATLALPSGRRVRVAVTHLHHVVQERDIRDEQASMLTGAWTRCRRHMPPS